MKITDKDLKDIIDIYNCSLCLEDVISKLREEGHTIIWGKEPCGDWIPNPNNDQYIRFLKANDEEVTNGK